MERGKKEIRREDTWQEWHDGRRVGSEESKKAGCTENRERERENKGWLLQRRNVFPADIM